MTTTSRFLPPIPADADLATAGVREMLFFPVTPFRSDGAVDHDVFASHLRERLPYGPPAVFAACGTGELASLGMTEHREVVRTAAESCGDVPVFAGIGGGLGVARAQALAAEDAGASGLLVLPPYLNEAPQSGWLEYYRRIAETTDLPVIVYQRNQVRLDRDTCLRLAETPTIIGLKDGLGDLDQIRDLVQALGDQWVFCNGLPTAELNQIEFRELGVRSYSSAVFAFFPEMAVAYKDALADGNTERLQHLLDGFYRPLGRLRDEVPGYAVALVKAALQLTDPAFGNVREPLMDPTPGHLERLQQIIEAGREALATTPSGPTPEAAR